MLNYVITYQKNRNKYIYCNLNFIVYVGGVIIKITLFIILFLCCMFYLFLGIYSYKIDSKSKTNQVFSCLSFCCVLWAGGYGL